MRRRRVNVGHDVAGLELGEDGGKRGDGVAHVHHYRQVEGRTDLLCAPQRLESLVPATLRDSRALTPTMRSR